MKARLISPRLSVSILDDSAASSSLNPSLLLMISPHLSVSILDESEVDLSLSLCLSPRRLRRIVFSQPISPLDDLSSSLRLHPRRLRRIVFSQPISPLDDLSSSLCDAAIKSVSEPKINQVSQTGHLGDASDRGSVQSEYLNNQKKVMDFTSQAIFSASIGADQPHFGPYKSNHEEASTEAICYVNEGLLGVQIKKNQARNPIQSEVLLGLLNFPKLVKPTLFMESSQPIRFGPTQTYFWKPGDTLSQPEDVQDFLQYTSTQWIRRIYSCFNLPYLESLAINLQQLLPKQVVHDFSTYQAIKKIPRKLSYPLKPSRFKKNQVPHLWPSKSHSNGHIPPRSFPLKTKLYFQVY
ncbi:hypothetical protein DY000_02062733 [Brassica cretica]|uniref:Uncharacterized protein n=1 Tax=Brassica cretica TaxID=69181 RepID=A0ABQ7AY97_BRACR|nr:hypothetical protein DY000_02062733 [Brassica cretica]